jgi:uncharacterized protein
VLPVRSDDGPKNRSRIERNSRAVSARYPTSSNMTTWLAGREGHGTANAASRASGNVSICNNFTYYSCLLPRVAGGTRCHVAPQSTGQPADRVAGYAVGVERPRIEIVDGKALYDGRSLMAWAPRVADRIVERCGATRVVLHGSVARGDDGPDSDIDLLVVMSFEGRRHDASVRVLNELRDLPVPVDITVVDPSQLSAESALPGVVRVAVREGRLLVDAA